MDLRIEAGHGLVEVSSGREDIRFRVARRTVVIGWNDITGAGMARAPSAPTSAPREGTDSLPGGTRELDVIPFGSRLVGRIAHLNATHRALVVAYGKGDGFQVFLPEADPPTRQLVAELSARLGERWLDGDWEVNALRKRLGIRATWPGRALGFALVVTVGVGGFLAIVGWAGLLHAWQEGDFSLIRVYTLVPLVLWCGFAWYALRRLRS